MLYCHINSLHCICTRSDFISRNYFLCSSTRSNPSSFQVLSWDFNYSVTSSDWLLIPLLLLFTAHLQLTSSNEVLTLQFVKNVISVKCDKAKCNKTETGLHLVIIWPFLLFLSLMKIKILVCFAHYGIFSS